MLSDTENYKKLKIFFDEEYHSLKAYAKSRIEDAADRDAEDIVQDVALKIFSRADNASPITNIAGYVYNSIKNKVIDIMRSRREDLRMENEMESRLIELTELFYGKSDNSYPEKMMSQLKKVIINLKPHYKSIVIAIDFEGYTYKEVSAETGTPEGTLMSQRHRALGLLFKELETKKERSN